MLRVGLTGGIGSGKSTVAALLRDLGAVVTDADAVAREVVEPGRPALAAIATEFGPPMLRADGTLDRAALAAIVFPDPDRLRALEAITGPAIAARSAELRAQVPRDRIDVYDMPLLVEKGLWVHEHLTLVVGAAEDIRVRRLVEHRGLPEADARARIAAQASDEQRRAAADVWIDNEGSRESTAEQVRAIWAERLVPYEANLRGGIRARRSEQLALHDPDPAWAARGERVCARIAAALPGKGVRVDHIGSTAVPGLLAKDVVDVQVGVRQLADADDPAFVAALGHAGYLCSPDNRGDTPHPPTADPSGWGKRFYGGQDPGCIVHVHVREIGSAAYDVALAFRDWLRDEPAVREEYAALKTRVAAAASSTSEYTTAKEPWFATAHPRLVAWTRAHGWTP
ncbi:MAG TPA: dephospho-CoA kinase [Dermatophilaceae bacterium]|nr:dephospho-CoA kinase [Dermatophilaceae bacterium]